MAKASWQDSYNNPPSWARDLREKRLREEEAAAARRVAAENDNAKYNAQVDAIQEDAGVIFDDNTRRSMIESLRSGRRLRVDTTQEDTPAQPVLPVQAKQEEDKGLLGNLYEGATNAFASLFGRNEAARASETADAAEWRASHPLEGDRKATIKARLAAIDAGTATSPRPVMTGIPGLDAPEMVETPLSARDAERERQSLLRNLADIEKKEAAGVYQAESVRLKEEARRERARAEVASQVAQEAEARLPAGVAKVSSLLGSGATPSQLASVTLPLATGVATRSPAAVTAVASATSANMAIKARNAAFAQAKNQFNATDEEAEAYAYAVASIEFGSEALGSVLGVGATLGKTFLGKLGKGATKEAATEALEKVVSSRLKRFAAGQAVEAGSEMASVLGQRLLDTSLEGTSFGGEAGQAALRQANEDFSYTQQLGDAALGSILIGGAPGVAGSRISYNADIAAQRNRRVQDILAADAASLQKPAEVPAQRPVTEPTQPDMFGTPANLPTVEETQAARQKAMEEDAAWAIRNRERQQEQPTTERQARRDELRTSIQNRVDTARQDVEALQDRIENGDVDSATLNTAAAANARLREAETALRNFDESFAAPQQPEATAPAAAPARAEEAAPVQGDLLEGVRATELSAAADKIKTAKEREQARAAKEAAAAKAAETARQNRLAAQVVKEHGDKTEAEQAQILVDLVANPEAKATTAPKEKTVEEKIQGVINQVEGMRERRNTQRVSNRIRNLYRQDPTRTAKDIADILAQEEGTVQTTDTTPDEADLRAQIANMKRKPGSLSMDEVPAAATLNEREASLDAGVAPAVRTPEKQAAFEAKVRELVSGMANTKEDVAIHNLIKQGKLIITDNPVSVGRRTKGSVAEFVPATGKMYMYADNIGSGPQAKAAILRAAAAHEGGHAGSFSPREGRGGIMQYIMGEKGNAEANTLIRKLADQGNVTAKKAVALAKRAAEVNKGFSNVEDLELVPYVLSELRVQSPGRLGKIVRDAKAGARKLGRSVGMDIDFTLDDIAIAAEQVADEIVKTDTLKPADTGASLEMTGGRNATGFKEAQRAGKTYRLPGDRPADNHDRFEFSDARAEFTSFGLADVDAAVRSKGNYEGSITDVLSHDEAYKQYPSLKNVKFYARDLEGLFGRYDPSEDAVYVDSNLVHLAATIPDAPSFAAKAEGKDLSNYEFLRNTVLHEVQHAVQKREGFVAGTTINKSAINRALDRRNNAMIDYNNYITSFAENLDTITSALPQEARQKWDNMLETNDPVTPVGKAIDFLANNLHKEVPINKWVLTGDRFRDIVARKVEAENYYREVEAREYENYRRNQGEVEARKTETNSRKTQEEIDSSNVFDSYDVPADQTTGSGRLPRRAASLSMAATEETKAANPKFAINERIARILSHGRQERLETVKIAEDLHTQFVDAYKKDTGVGRFKKAGISAEVNKAMTEFLSSAEQATPEGRVKLVAELGSKYPETTKVLLEARDRISDMTVDIIDDMLSTGRPLSVTQRKQIATMVANKDTYLSRAYAAFQQEKGRKWAKGRWANFVKNADTALDDITDPKVKADVKAVRDAITVIQKSLHIPDTEVMQDLPMSSLEALAARHGIKDSQLQFDRNDPDATFLKRDEIISELEKIKEAFPEDKLYDMALRDAKDLMGLGNRDSAYARQMSEMVKNPGTLKERQRVPLEIRRMLGEIELAPGVFVATMANQASLRARAKVISELINDPQGDIAISKEDFFNLPDGVTSDNSTLLEVAANAVKPRSARTKADYREVNGEEWGALNGMYLHKKAYSRMEEATGLMYTWSDALSRMSHDINPITGKIVRGLGSTLGSLNRWNKLTTVVYNPISWGGNLSGSFLNMVGAGNFSPTALKEGMGAAREYVEGTFNTTTTPRLSKVIRYMNLEAADIAEMQRVLGDTLEKYFRSPESFQNGEALLNKHASGLAGRAHKSVIAGYAIMDNWSKIANFYHRYEVLRSMYEAAGVKKTEDQILQEAGDDTSYTNISPERVQDVIRAAESAGVSQYAPYFAEVLRTRVTNLALAHKDFKRGKQLAADGKQKAANIMYRTAVLRVAGQAIANVGMPMVGAIKLSARLAALGVPAAAAATIVNGLSALGGDEEDNEKKRRMLSEMNRVQDLMQVGKTKDGFPIYYAYSQKLDPNGPFTDLIRSFVYADDYEDVYKNLTASSLYIFPQILKDTWNAMAGENFPESDVGRLWPQLKQTLVDAGVSANDADRYLNVADNVIPGVARAWKTQNTVEGIDVDPETKKFLERMNLVGARFETLDPRRTLKTYAGDSKDAKAENNGALNRSLINVPRPTEKSVLEATGDFYKKELERQVKDYRNTVDSLKSWGFDNEQIAVLLKQGGYPEKDIPDMLEGVASVKLSLKSFLDYADKSGGYQDSREYEKRREKAAEIANMIIEMKPQLEELGIEVDTTGIPKEWKE